MGGGGGRGGPFVQDFRSHSVVGDLGSTFTHSRLQSPHFFFIACQREALSSRMRLATPVTSYASTSDWFSCTLLWYRGLITTPIYTPSNLSCSKFKQSWFSVGILRIQQIDLKSLYIWFSYTRSSGYLFAESEDCGVHIFGFIFNITFS